MKTGIDGLTGRSSNRIAPAPDRVVAWLGKLDEAGRLGIEQAARNTPSSADSTAPATHSTAAPSRRRQLALFDQPDTDDTPVEPRWGEVNAAAVRVENCVQFGGPWVALELVKQLELDDFLRRAIAAGREHVPWWRSALILVAARLCRPSSELYVAEQWYPGTALPDLLGVAADRVDDNRLYRTLDRLLPYKEQLEVHLKKRLGELFDLEYDLLMYDVTSTYFEGQAKATASG